MNLEKYYKVKQTKLSPESRRIFIEADYLIQLAKLKGDFFSDCFDNVVEYLDGLAFVTREDVLRCEEMLSSVKEQAKSIQCLCVAHAHIDVNWMWGYNETVSIALSTMETMVKLLERYPRFTFAQSSAFLYEIIAKYRPSLLEKIKKYIAEGRFEVSASTFVEADKNIPDANALIRQTEYTKRRLSSLLGLKEEDLCLDFEPDTFGHSAYVPEILQLCGVKYYYHCRGNEMPPMYRWKAPSGKFVTVYREPHWYNGAVQDDSFEFVPDFCSRYGTEKVLFVYGVGDHGGGATIRDIEKIEELSSYPLMADIKFGTYREFFDYIAALDLPVAEGEQNKIFSGCYSSQSELKKQNALTQTALYAQEFFCSLDPVRTDYDNSHAVECLLANQFHDAVTGSGVADTFNFAMGRYQEAQAELGAYTAEALSHLTQRINTLPLYKNLSADPNDTAFGAGAGYGTADLNFTNHIAYGNERAFTVFNPLNFARKSTIRIPLWDYCGDPNRLHVFDAEGNELDFVLKNAAPAFYWGHGCSEFEISLELPALSCRSLVLREVLPHAAKEIGYPPLFQRTEEAQEDIVLENDILRAVFDSETFSLVSLFDKRRGEEKLSAPAQFFLETEDTTEQMTAWYVGRIKQRNSLHRGVRLIPGSRFQNNISCGFGFEVRFGQSVLQAFFRLDRGADALTIRVCTDFFERGDPQTGIPSLAFRLPLLPFEKAICDTPPGIVERPQANRDIPCSSFMEGDGVMLIADGKHGFRAFGNNLSLRLLRASCDPHPYPEYGKHCFSFCLRLSEGGNTERLHASQDFRIPPIAVALEPHGGNMAADSSLKEISDNVVCISLNRERTILFNAEKREVCAHCDGRRICIPPYSFKKI